MRKKNEVSTSERLWTFAGSVAMTAAAVYAPNARDQRLARDVAEVGMAHSFFGDRRTTNQVAQSKGYGWIFDDEPEDPPKSSCPCVIL